MPTLFDLEEPAKGTLTQYLHAMIDRLDCSEKTIIVAIIYMQRYFDCMNSLMQ